MRAIRAAGVVLLCLSGCGRPPVITALAPEGALACAVAHAEAAGYEIVEGGVSRGNVRLIRDVEPAAEVSRGEPLPADVGSTLLNRPAGSPSQEQLLLRYAGGQLEATAIAMSGRTTNEDAGATTRQQATMILNVCAADPGAVPIGASPGPEPSLDR